MGVNSPTIERMVVAMLYRNPEVREKYPHLPDLLFDKAAKEVTRALYRLGSVSPQIIAEAAQINITEVEKILSTPTDDLDIHPLVELLSDLRRRALVLEKVKDATSRIKAGAADPSLAMAEIARYAATIGVNSTDLWGSARWLAERGAALAEKRKAQQVITFPDNWYVLRKAIPSMEPGVYFFLSLSSVGKTGFALQTAYHLARLGLRVAFRGNEESADTMSWRLIASQHSWMRYDDLRQGRWDSECERIIASINEKGGDIIYIERDLHPSQLMAITDANRMDALFIDVFQNLPKTGYGRNSDVTAIDEMLRDFVEWSRASGKIVFGTLQLDKGSTLNAWGGISEYGAKGSNDFYSQAAVLMTAHFPKVPSGKVYNIADPFNPAVKHKIDHNRMFPIGMITLSKNRYGPKGLNQYVWFDASRMWYYPIPERLVEVAKNHYEMVIEDSGGRRKT